MSSNVDKKMYSEKHIGNGIGFTVEDMDISRITFNYLIGLGMGEDQIIDLHKAVWDLALPHHKPENRKKMAKKEAKRIKNEIESEYEIDNYDKPLISEPLAITYDDCIQQVLTKLRENEIKTILINGGCATGKTIMAKRIKRLAQESGLNIEAYDDHSVTPWKPGNYGILSTQYSETDIDADFRIFVYADKWRKYMNGLKRMWGSQPVQGLFTQNMELRERYEIDFQKHISDIVVNNSKKIRIDPRDRKVQIDKFESYSLSH
jgi:hypothetical protein